VFTKNRDRLQSGEVLANFMTKLLNHPQVKPLLSDEQGRQRRCDGGADFHGQKYLFGKKRQQQEQSRQ